jgi:hypothetical protein
LFYTGMILQRSCRIMRIMPEHQDYFLYSVSIAADSSGRLEALTIAQTQFG